MDLLDVQSGLDVSEPVTVLQSYTGLTLGETGSLPPDPSGAAGPSQFILAANGRIRSFSKNTGAADGVLNVASNTFFTPVRNGAAVRAPKVKYDRLAGRWFIIAGTDALPGRIVIASSNASTIVANTVWSFFFFDNSYPAVTTCAIDSPTLGIDNAALYVGVVQFCDAGTTYGGTSGYVVRKTSVIDAAAIAVTGFHGLTGNASGQGPFAPVGVDNDDPASAVGYFIGVDNASLGMLMLRRVSNPGVTPTISGNIAIAVAATAAPITVRHLGNTGGTNGQLDGGDDRLTSAVIRNGTSVDGADDRRARQRPGQRLGEPQRGALVRDRIAGRHAGGAAAGDAVRGRRLRQRSRAQLLGAVHRHRLQRPHGPRLQRGRRLRVRQRRRRRAVVDRCGEHAARTAALHRRQRCLQPARRSRRRAARPPLGRRVVDRDGRLRRHDDLDRAAVHRHGELVRPAGGANGWRAAAGHAHQRDAVGGWLRPALGEPHGHWPVVRRERVRRSGRRLAVPARPPSSLA